MRKMPSGILLPLSKYQFPRKGKEPRGHKDCETHGLGAARFQTYPKEPNMNAPFFPPDPETVISLRAASIDGRRNTIGLLQMLWRRRQAWVRADVRLVLQAQALCRLLVDNDKKAGAALYKASLEAPTSELELSAAAMISPLEAARLPILAGIKATDKDLIRMAKVLPGASLCAETKGLGIKGTGFASIIGEAGDLAVYANPGKLWKRMGLAPLDGKSYATWRSTGGLKAEDWTTAGYSPARRSVMFNVGNGLIGGMGNGKRPIVGEDLADLDWTPYEKLFVERLRHEAARDPSMALPPTKEGKESYTKHAAARAKRYVEKRFLRELWKEWRYAEIGSSVPEASPG